MLRKRLLATPQSNRNNAAVYKVDASQRWSPLDLQELWQHRELLYYLMWRDIKVRYKQTIIGAGWAIIQPVVTMLVFSIFFGRLLNIPSNGIPYPVFSYAALVPWTYFSNAIGQASDSLLGNASLLKQIYVARLVMRVAAML